MDIFKKYEGRSYQSVFESWVLEIEEKLTKLDKVIEDYENKNNLVNELFSSKSNEKIIKTLAGETFISKNN